MKTVIFFHYLLPVIFSCWKGQVWHGLAHCSLLALSVRIRQDLSWQQLILETDLPFWISSEVCLFSPGHCWTFTDSTHFFSSYEECETQDGALPDGQCWHTPTFCGEQSKGKAGVCRELNAGPSQPWPCAPWQVTHSPPTPSVTKAVAVTTQTTPLNVGFAVAVKLQTTFRTPVSATLQSTFQLWPPPDSSWLFCSTICVFPKVLQVCSHRQKGVCRSLQSGQHTVSDWLHLSYLILENWIYLPRPGLESALAGSCLSFFPLIFLF